MLMENADDVIQHAQTQESMAYKAKKQAYHDLQKQIHRRYGEQILDHYKVRNYAIQVRPNYDSTSISLYLHILPDYGYEETLKEIDESEMEESYRVSSIYSWSIEDEIRETVLDDLDLETDINIKVKTKEQFERLKDK